MDHNIKKLAESILETRKSRIENSGMIYFPLEIKKRPCVLVVDDDFLIRESIKRILEEEKYIVVTASEGAELVEVLLKYPIDCIILDLHLPWINGIELCKMLRNPTFNLTHVPLVFLSGNNELEIKKQAFEAGGDDYLEKPVDPKFLLNTIKTLIKLSSVELHSKV